MFKLLICFISIAISLMGCASEILRTPTQLSRTTNKDHEPAIIFHDDVIIKLSSGYHREIKRGTKWKFVGIIKEGSVYKSTDSVFTIEGAHVREAYLVILNNQLIGFYTPGENSFSSVGSSMTLPIHAENKSRNIAKYF